MVATLHTYLQGVQRLLRDQRQDLLDPGDLVEYINEARRETAMRTQCIRRLTPIAGSVVSASVTAAGSGYSNNPTVTLSAPDFPSGVAPFPNGDQATAAAIVQTGTIAAVNITYGGAGYWEPTVTITDSTGTGATATAAATYINATVQGMEVYNFGDIDLTMFPGIDSIYVVQGVSVLFNSFRYSLACYSFSTHQALIRQWAQQWQYAPVVCAQYGQGTDGSFYLYPVPSQPYQMEWDCLCMPQDLTTNLSVEAIPVNWQDVVKFYAAYLAFAEIQNYNASRYYLDLFDKMVERRSRYARPGRATTYYGRY